MRIDRNRIKVSSNSSVAMEWKKLWKPSITLNLMEERSNWFKTKDVDDQGPGPVLRAVPKAVAHVRDLVLNPSPDPNRLRHDRTGIKTAKDKDSKNR